MVIPSRNKLWLFVCLTLIGLILMSGTYILRSLGAFDGQEAQYNGVILFLVTAPAGFICFVVGAGTALAILASAGKPKASK